MFFGFNSIYHRNVFIPSSHFPKRPPIATQSLKGGACGALAVHIFLSDESGEVVSLQRLVILPLNRRTLPNRKRDRYCSFSNLYEKVNNQV